jgi:hypothetical protein
MYKCFVNKSNLWYYLSYWRMYDDQFDLMEIHLIDLDQLFVDYWIRISPNVVDVSIKFKKRLYSFVFNRINSRF